MERKMEDDTGGENVYIETGGASRLALFGKNHPSHDTCRRGHQMT